MWAHIDERWQPALRRAGVEVQWTDVVVRHVGYNDPTVRKSKLARDRAILEAELADRPDDPFVLFNFGQVALEAGEPAEAIRHMERSLAQSAPSDSITRKLHALIACTAGLRDVPDDAELLFRKGVLHRLRGDADEAGTCWRRILGLKRPDQFASLDMGIYGHVTRRNLARLAEDQDALAEARVHWSAVLAECPSDAEAVRALRRLARSAVPVAETSS